MSVVDGVGRKLTEWANLIVSAMGWMAFTPLLLIPRRKDWIAVIGREDGKFLDNAKYFFLQAGSILGPHVRIAFITEREGVARMLSGSGHEVLTYPTRQCVWLLLRAGTVVVDSMDWTRNGRGYLLLGAKAFQLWHGVGYKRIELDLWRHRIRDGTWLTRKLRYPVFLAKAAVLGLFVRYDAFLATSAFYRDEVFRRSFLSHHFLIAGYPRNTFDNVPQNLRAVIRLNVDTTIADRIERWLADQKRVVLVAPTFRDSGEAALSLDSRTIMLIDAFCEEKKIELVFKLHPFDKSTTQIQGKHLHVCSPDSDLYPLMPMSNALITDYSSVYMDYLHLDKPVIFLIEDIERYTKNSRQFQFDPIAMMPGPTAKSWQALLGQLDSELKDDTYRDARAKLRRLAFDDLPQEQATSAILGYMQREKWITPACA